MIFRDDSYKGLEIMLIWLGLKCEGKISNGKKIANLYTGRSSLNKTPIRITIPTYALSRRIPSPILKNYIEQLGFKSEEDYYKKLNEIKGEG